MQVQVNKVSLPSGVTANIGGESDEMRKAFPTQGKVKAVIAKTFSLQEVQQAHELSQLGHGRGRIILHIAD